MSDVYLFVRQSIVLKLVLRTATEVSTVTLTRRSPTIVTLFQSQSSTVEDEDEF
jgi:hypothetical protein